MKELSKKKKLYVINEMIRYYKNVKDHAMCMCPLLDNIIEFDLGISTDPYGYDFQILFPEFCNNKPKNAGLWWFDYGASRPRLNYCKKIKSLII